MTLIGNYSQDRGFSATIENLSSATYPMKFLMKQ